MENIGRIINHCSKNLQYYTWPRQIFGSINLFTVLNSLCRHATTRWGGEKKGNIAIFVGGRISKRCTIFHATRRGGIITWLQMGVGILKIDKRQIERGKQMDKFVGRNPSLLNISWRFFYEYWMNRWTWYLINIIKIIRFILASSIKNICSK